MVDWLKLALVTIVEFGVGKRFYIAACVSSVESILRKLLGVKRAMVALATSLGEVEYDCYHSVHEDSEEGPENSGLKKEKGIVYCVKTDGKAWECKREAAKGNSSCKHHLSQVRNYSLALPAAKKQDKVVADYQRLPRRRRQLPHQIQMNFTTIRVLDLDGARKEVRTIELVVVLWLSKNVK
ncbi:copper-transporting ATPase RAN1-like [Olea europaea subsp. europaea]|uniref:Copper-transporting ATPase RAN1-like n=1 Tax=Olea europaea subsp. europaea TaxID=158383 RepID=A0A8S0T731_OLEEU|nr:copper-transporting ATPase RAN1-like [Olea europaea subsp. europaea]